MHSPTEQASPVVQKNPSSQASPSLVGCDSQALVVSLQVPTVHCPSKTEQSLADPPPQTPSVQISLIVQKSPSLQKAPSLIGCGSQVLVVSLQTPVLH